MPTSSSNPRLRARPPGRLARRRWAIGWLAALGISALAGCSVLWLTHPPDLPARQTEIVPKTGGPAARVEALVDDRGIPHIYGQSETDLAYALGFFHARDRLFQILVLKHASQGRLTELFGDDLLGTDLAYRLLTYRLDDAVAALSLRDRALIDAYLDGLNKGAAHAGPSAEMDLLDVEWTPMTPRDVIALFRLQAWGLSMDAEEELGTGRILARLPEDDERREALVRPVPTGGVPIVYQGPAQPREQRDGGPAPDDEERSPADGGTGTGPSPLPLPSSDEDGGTLPPLEEIPVEPEARREAVEEGLRLVRALGLRLPGEVGKGASNSWVVSGAHTASGKPVLVNDPHLRHLLPSTFYLAHLETPELRAVGATFPGLPAVVIGHTRHLAWGVTASVVDTQDLLELAVDPADDRRYVLDGQPRDFGSWPQRFIADEEVIRSQVWETTVFGPVLTEAYDHLAEPGPRFAVLWTGFDPALNAQNLSGYWDLYAAEDLAEARAALEKIGSPSQSVVLALQDGTIAYHLAGAVPRRRGGAPLDRPREGRSSDAAFSGTLSLAEKPSLEDPPQGFVVTANQRITDDSGPRQLGRRAATPHRAERIHALLRPLIARGGVTAEELLALQQDVLSVEAERLSPILAAHCPEQAPGADPAMLKALCQSLREWDGRYTTTALGALPFTWLLEALTTEVLSAHLGPDLAFQLRFDPAVVMAIERAILDEAAGDKSPLLDDRRTVTREGLPGFVSRAAVVALERIEDEAGDEPEDWRWGRHHIWQPQGPLVTAPVVGGLFDLPWRPQAGSRHTIRAETGVPVRSGAVLRYVAELTDPIQARFTLDLGQSGHLGHPHLDDMRDDWDRGNPRPVPVEKEAIPLESHVIFLPGAEPDEGGGETP